MAWSDVRARLKVDLEAVSITSPITKTIARVYAFPPETLQDNYSIVLMPAARAVTRHPSDWREKVYTQLIRIQVRDDDADRAAEILDAFAEAIIDALDSDVALNNTCDGIEGPDFAEPEVSPYGLGFLEMVGTLTIRVSGVRTFAA